MTKVHTLIALLLLAATGCTQAIYPQARPADPVKVFVADYGVHSSMMLPTADGRYAEYSFGDWRYAAMNRMGPHDAIAALTISFQSAVGRRYVTIQPGQSVPVPREWKPKRWTSFYAGRAEVNGLLAKLDARFEREAATRVYNRLNDTEYVKDRERYSFANNCNHLTVRSLRDLKCDVRGVLVSSKFRVARQQAITPDALADSQYATAGGKKTDESPTAAKVDATPAIPPGREETHEANADALSREPITRLPMQ
jgi:hypothetical protein